MAALSIREIGLFRLIYQALRLQRTDMEAMHEKVAELHSKFEALEASAAVARQRESAYKAQVTDLQAEIAVAKGLSLSDDTLSALDGISARVDALAASLATPA